MLKQAIGVIGFLLFANFTVQAETIEFEAVPANVPYSKVAKLSSSPWDKKITYGEANDQFILHWKAKANAELKRKPNNDKPVNSPSSTIIQNKRVAFIHGGCWLEEFSIEHSFAFTTALAQQGFEVFSIEYRRTGNGGEWPVALHDIESAVAKIQALTKKQDIPLTLVGHSAGGHLGSLAAFNIAQGTQKIHFVGLAPIIDLPAYAQGDNDCQTATPGFMQGMPATPSKAANPYEQANPLNYDLSGLASATVFAGGQDDIVPVKLAMHEQVKFVVAEDAGHFDWIHPGSDAFKRLVEHLNKIVIL